MYLQMIHYKKNNYFKIIIFIDFRTGNKLYIVHHLTIILILAFYSIVCRGLMGIDQDEEFGGSGLDSLAYAVTLTEISRGCAR